MTTQQYGIPPQHGMTPPHSGKATAAMILGFLGPFTFGITALIAIVLGHVAEAETRNGRMTGRREAITGMVLGWVVATPAILLWIMTIAMRAK